MTDIVTGLIEDYLSGPVTKAQVVVEAGPTSFPPPIVEVGSRTKTSPPFIQPTAKSLSKEAQAKGKLGR